MDTYQSPDKEDRKRECFTPVLYGNNVEKKVVTNTSFMTLSSGFLVSMIVGSMKYPTLQQQGKTNHYRDVKQVVGYEMSSVFPQGHTRRTKK